MTQAEEIMSYVDTDAHTLCHTHTHLPGLKFDPKMPEVGD